MKCYYQDREGKRACQNPVKNIYHLKNGGITALCARHCLEADKSRIAKSLTIKIEEVVR